jgi:hypothetical protein
MFVKLKGAKNNKSNSRKKSSDNKELTEDDMPERWMFNGWFAFVLYGSRHALARNSLSCFSEDGKDVPKESRAESRKQQVKIKDAKRCTDSMENRGISTEDHLTMATLSQAEFREETRNLRELMALDNQDYLNTVENLKLIQQMMKDADTEKERLYHRRRRLQLMYKLEQLDERKKKLMAESDKLRDDANNKKVTMMVSHSTYSNTSKDAPPKQISLNHSTTINSSLSNSGGSYSNKKRQQEDDQSTGVKKKAAKSGGVIELLQSDVEDDNNNNDDEDEDEDNGGMFDSQLLGQSSSYESPIPEKAPVNKRVCPVEASLDERGKAVMAAFREKQKTSEKQVDYGMDYMYDYN